MKEPILLSQYMANFTSASVGIFSDMPQLGRLRGLHCRMWLLQLKTSGIDLVQYGKDEKVIHEDPNTNKEFNLGGGEVGLSSLLAIFEAAFAQFHLRFRAR
jgi:hypothetical protein